MPSNSSQLQRRIIKDAAQILADLRLTDKPLAAEVDYTPDFALRVPASYLQNIPTMQQQRWGMSFLAIYDL